MASIGNLVVTIAANTKPLVTGLAQARAAVSSFASSTAKSVASLGALLGGGGLLAAGAGFVTLAAGVERTAVQFEVMLGSASSAKRLLEDIRQFSIKSPFGMTDLQDAARVLLNFGVTAKNVMPILSALGDIAAGDTERLSRLTLAFAQMSAAGKLMGQDLLQMVNAGFSPLQEISRKTGESMLALRKRMEDGGILSGEVTNAFISATSAGGRFFNMTNRIAGTTIGKWMVLKDQVTLLAIGIGTELLPMANKMLDWASGLVAKLQGIPGVVRSVMTSIGSFVTMASNAIQDLGVIIGTTWVYMQTQSAAVWQDIATIAVARMIHIGETVKTVAINIGTAFANAFKIIATAFHNIMAPVNTEIAIIYSRLEGLATGRWGQAQADIEAEIRRMQPGEQMAAQGGFRALPEFEMPAQLPGLSGLADALEGALAKDRAARAAIGNVPKPGEGPGFKFDGSSMAGAAGAKRQQLGAVQAGSAEAYRLIGDILGAKKDPVVDAVADADHNIVAAIGQLGGVMAGVGVGAIVPSFLP